MLVQSLTKSEKCDELEKFTKDPKECCTIPKFSNTKAIKDKCYNECLTTDDKSCCYKKCTVREPGVFADGKFSAEKYRDIFSESSSEHILRDEWKLVIEKVIAKCESKSNFLAILND